MASDGPEVMPPEDKHDQEQGQKTGRGRRRERSDVGASHQSDEMSEGVALAEILAKGSQARDILDKGARAAGILMHHGERFIVQLLARVKQLEDRETALMTEVRTLNVQLVAAQAASSTPASKVLEGVEVAKAIGEIPIIAALQGKALMLLGAKPPEPQPEEAQEGAPGAVASGLKEQSEGEEEIACPACQHVFTPV